MYKADFEATAESGLAKMNFFKTNPKGYLISSMLAGAYIGFGSLLTNTIGGVLDGAPATKVVTGVAFSVALSLVIMAGAELFTGKNAEQLVLAVIFTIARWLVTAPLTCAAAVKAMEAAAEKSPRTRLRCHQNDSFM